jgi:hypothetical protein
LLGDSVHQSLRVLGRQRDIRFDSNHSFGSYISARSGLGLVRISIPRLDLITLEILEHVDHPSASTALIAVPASAID